MNIKKLYGMFFALLLLAGVVSAQTTFYVNNLTGNDANSGLSSDQAKATVNSAMIAAPAGSIISVAATGVNYTEAAPVVRGTYTFFSTGGTPIFTNAFNVGVGGWVGAGITGITVAPNSVVTTAAAHGVKNGDVVYIAGTGAAAYDGKYFTASAVTATTFVINNTTGAALGAGGNVAAKGAVTFTAPFEFDGGLNLNVGTLDGGNNVTVMVGVYRTELASILSGSLVYSGNVALTYANLFTAAGATITTGLEWPAALTPVGVTTQNTTGAITLKLENAKTMGGVLTTAGPTNLNTFTLQINGANAHTIGGNVTNGTLYFNMTGATSIGGAFTVPNVTAYRSTAATLTLGTALVGTSLTGVTGTTTLNGAASVTSLVNGDMGNIAVNGTGAFLMQAKAAPTTIGTVTMDAASTGNVTLDHDGVTAGALTTGILTNNGTGTLTFGVAANVTAINVGTAGTSTNVVLGTAVPAIGTAASGTPVRTNLGRIIFTDVPVTVWGQVQNNASFSGSSDQAGNNGNGLILFQNTASLVTIKNTVLNNITGSWTFTAGGGTQNGEIQFANTTGNLVFAGVTNSSTASLPATNGRIVATGGGTGTLTFTNMLNSSTDADFNIDFTLMTGAISGTTISSTGTTTGGDILLGNGTPTITGDITSTRGATGADIVIGTAASAVTFSGRNLNNSGKSIISIASVSGVGQVLLTTYGISNTGTGSITFPNAGAGAGAPAVAFSFTAFTVSSGTVDFGNGTGGINIAGVVSMTGGTINFSGAAAKTVTLSNASIQIGGIGTKPTFGGTSVNLTLAQPIPNVNQTITLGTLDNTFPGYLTVSNTAAIPAPYVFFKSAAGTDTNQPGLLYVTNQVLAVANGVTFDTGNPAVVNTVQIDNARIYIGKNSAFNGGGFQNTSGYTTANGGFVMMAGGAGIAQPVNGAAIYAGATFGNFGVSNNSGTTPCVTFGAATAVMMGDFYLATGQVNPANLWFGIATAPYSTIYRTEGTFSAPITVGNITSYVNVTYYGGDKTTSNEVPATKLWNLTVATTNGTKPGYGIITMTGGITVSGTLTINANQTLYTGANGLTLAGSSAVVNGYLVDDGTARVVLGAATGTAITGTGYLPSLIVGNASVGNTVNGNLGLFAAALGAGVWDGGDDDFTNADGSISYQTGAGDTNSSLTVSFTGNGPHFANLTIGAAPVSTVGTETFTLGSNVVMSGNINQASGLISLGDYTLTHQGAAFVMDGDTTTPFTPSAITSNAAGKLQFVTNNTTLTVTTAPATIAANVDFNAATARTFKLPAYVAGVTDMLTINGNVTLSGAGGATVDIGNANTLTLGGATVTVGTGSSFTAVAGGTTGILNLDVVAPNTTLTYTTPAASSIVNLTVSDNVTLAGGVAGSTLTVTNFVHNAGLFTFGTANLSIGAAAVGTFTRNGGTYAGDGWLIYNGAAAGFQHSALVAAGTMVINNFQLTQAMTLQNARQLNVVKTLYLNGGTLTNSVLGGATGYVVMGDVTTVPLVQVVLPATVATNALQFANTNADFTFNGATGAIAANVWPATATLARNVVVNMAAAANILTIPTRTINGNLTLTTGILQWDSPVVVTIGSGSTITRTAAGFLDWDTNANGTTGTFTAPLVNLVYTGNVTGAAPSGTGIEYSQPTVVNNFTLGTAAAAQNTLNAARNIDGVVTLFTGSTLTVGQNTTFTVAQTITSGTIAVAAGKTLTINGNTTLPTTSGNITSNDDFTLRGAHTAGNVTVLKNVTLGTGGSLAATSNLVFGGAANQTITVLAGGSTIGGMTLAQTGTATTVTLVGGNLTTTALTTFTNGIFVTGANTLKLYHPNWNVLPAFPQGFDRSGVTGTNVSHVVGKVAKTTVNAGIVGWVGTSEPRVEFPVGTMTTYRPLVLTFGLSTSGGVPTVPNNTFTVSHTATNPAGQAALPIVGGVKTGVDIARYPSFYWYLMAANSVDPSIRFDLELDPTGFTGFGTNAYDARIIRRHGATTDTANPWLLQGFEAGVDITTRYDNEYNVSTGRFAVINRNSLAGLRADGATFTLGLSTNLATDVVPTNAAAKVATVRGVYTPSLYQNYVLNLEATGAKMFKNNVGTLRYAVTSSNTTLATASVAGTTLTVVPVAVGTANITVTAYDDANNDFMSYTFPVNIGLVGNDKQESAIPTEFAMSQNYPNPFNPTTAIKFAMPKESHVTIKVVNMLGQEVTTLVDEVRPAGYHVVNFNANGLASGHYVAIIKAGEFTKTIKMSLLK